ncbi:hypothetical protein IIQ43_19275 [Acinetobacter oleivorans]|uniref:Uncharacterized protein n=1 Tax=Acinetobacter oleivorans TaxID=1148157 RepID=A0ABR9NPM3_9GAMM|nr:hypothetical protein [Acinetobacter oleivorans]MBE2166660.1 hypothetical protein [Acinetobacter oleivorans]
MIISTNSHTGGGDEKKVIYPITEHMESHLKNVLATKNYGGGIDEFLIIPYAVFSDEKENSEFAKPSHKVQRTKDYYGDKGWIKTIVFALPFNPDEVSKMNCEKFRVLLCNTVLERLEDPQMKILKAFDYAAFKQDVAKEIIFYRDNIPFEQP